MQGNDPRSMHAWRTNDARMRVRAWHHVSLCLVIALAAAACTPKPEVVIHAGERPVRVKVELALTRDQHSQGLMYRQTMAADHGMLFVFDKTEIHGFWMKNTPLPLDMIFIDEDNEIVGIVENTVPFSTTNQSVWRPSRYVLEVNGGFSAAHGVKAGQTVDLPPLPASR